MDELAERPYHAMQSVRTHTMAIEGFSVNVIFRLNYLRLERKEMKRIVSGTMLALLLIGMLTLAFNIQPAESAWTGTVYIRADGSIDPPDAPITTYDNVTYTLTDNITSSYYDGIVVERDNIVIDGNRCTIQGTGSYSGIDLSNRVNVTIQNINIQNFRYGILLEYSYNNSISGNNITANNEYGIVLRGSSYNSIAGNNITANNEYGILLEYSYNNSISGNVFTNDGLFVWYSYGFVWYSYGNVVEDNLVNGKPLVYLEGLSNLRVKDAGQVILVNCTSITVENLNLTHTDTAIQLWNTNNTKITNNNIANNDVGIFLSYSSYNSISGNNIANNDVGIFLGYSSYNSISGNNIANNRNGIYLSVSYNSKVIRNNIANNGVGIYLSDSSYNSIYHNNFVDNTEQVYVTTGYTNVWDGGFPCGGNYWSDYRGLDLYSGPGQNEIGSDGVGDTLYVMDENNVDRYPLMAPFSTFDVGTWNGVAYSVDVVSNSKVSDFQFDVGKKSVSFSVAGDYGTVGFCRVAIPKDLLWVEDGWIITVGDQLITDYRVFQDENFNYIYFTYSHSIQRVTIQGTYVIPEFSSSLILSLFTVLSVIAVAFANKKRKR